MSINEYMAALGILAALVMVGLYCIAYFNRHNTSGYQESRYPDPDEVYADELEARRGKADAAVRRWMES